MFSITLQKHLTFQSIVLDVGAGAGIVEEMHFRGDVARICGVDLYPRVEQNDKFDEGKQADAVKWSQYFGQVCSVSNVYRF